MLVQQVKERIFEGSIHCICNTQSQNKIFQPSENLNFDTSSLGPTIVGPFKTLHTKEYQTYLLYILLKRLVNLLSCLQKPTSKQRFPAI